MTSFPVRLLAQCLWMMFSPLAVRSSICMWLHNQTALILSSLLKLLNTEFPSNTIVTREARSELVQFLTAAAPTILVNIDNTITGWYTELIVTLAIIKTGQWRQVK